MVSIKPTNQAIESELVFKTQVPESDRFKDISYLIYEQNSKLYQQFAKNQLKNDKSNAQPTEMRQSVTRCAGRLILCQLTEIVMETVDR